MIAATLRADIGISGAYSAAARRGDRVLIKLLSRRDEEMVPERIERLLGEGKAHEAFLLARASGNAARYFVRPNSRVYRRALAVAVMNRDVWTATELLALYKEPEKAFNLKSNEARADDPLKVAAERGDDYMFSWLVERGFQIHRNAWLRAIYNAEVTMTMIALDHGFDPDSFDCAAMRYASAHGDEPIVQLLLEAGATAPADLPAHRKGLVL